MLTLYVVFTLCMADRCIDEHVDTGPATLDDCQWSTDYVLKTVRETMAGKHYTISNQHCELEGRTGTYQVAHR